MICQICKFISEYKFQSEIYKIWYILQKTCNIFRCEYGDSVSPSTDKTSCASSCHKSGITLSDDFTDPIEV